MNLPHPARTNKRENPTNLILFPLLWTLLKLHAYFVTREQSIKEMMHFDHVTLSTKASAETSSIWTNLLFMQRMSIWTFFSASNHHLVSSETCRNKKNHSGRGKKHAWEPDKIIVFDEEPLCVLENGMASERCHIPKNTDTFGTCCPFPFFSKRKKKADFW